MLGRLSRDFLIDPFKLYLRARQHLDLSFMWKRYTKLCYKTAIRETIFILSFDCDTEEDIAVASDVHFKLKDIGITPVYAVPGKLLKKGEKVYRKIYDTGAEFINHGGCEHTYFDEKHKRHASCFFYDQQTLESLREDIVQGHQILEEVLGVTAKGWRTPHFGTFQNPQNLEFLYKTLRELNYTFSTSTSPAMAYRYGPLFKKAGIIEIPVTGIYLEPLNILDTWAYFAAPDRVKLPLDYLHNIQVLSQFSKTHPILINIYGDPSHIHDKLEFFEAMALLVKSAHNVNYTQLLEKTYENIRAI